MAKEVLLRRLDELHRELLAMKDVDAATVEAMQRVAEDIRQLIQTRELQDLPGDAASFSFREQIERMESEHPVMTRFLSQMTDFLAMLGI